MTAEAINADPLLTKTNDKYQDTVATLIVFTQSIDSKVREKTMFRPLGLAFKRLFSVIKMLKKWKEI